MRKKMILFALVLTTLMVMNLGCVLAAGGFDQYGYNNKARIFNGTGESWSLAKGLPADYWGAYAKDKLIMKWNSEWDRGNAENWANGPYAAWEDNEWNGAFKGGSGAVWHYKIVWIGGSNPEGTMLPDGGYVIWGQFEVIMDQGKDPSLGPGHFWFAKASPCGYGAFV
jgi:hypothetical protein